MANVTEEICEPINFQYIQQHLATKDAKKIFINHLNSYHLKPLVKMLLDQDYNKVSYELCGTLRDTNEDVEECQQLPTVDILNPYKDSIFFMSIISCDIIIFDITQDNDQLVEANRFVKFLQKEFEERPDAYHLKHFILISTIMTWARTPQNLNDEPISDDFYQKRRAHPCFIEHIILERQVMNMQKRFNGFFRSVVLCPAIIYGGREDLLHFVFKKCFLNVIQIDVFAPATNFLPLIYLDDFVRIVMKAIEKFPEVPYILAVQPESLMMKNVIQVLAEAVGGLETRIRICHRDEIFLMNDKLMTQRVYNHLTLNLRLESEYLSTFDFIMSGFNMELYATKLAFEFYNTRRLKPWKILIDGKACPYQTELAKLLADYYSLHHIQGKCFLVNSRDHLGKKIRKAEEYLRDMEGMKVALIDVNQLMDESVVNFEEIIGRVRNQMVEWRNKFDKIEDFLGSGRDVKEFDVLNEFIEDRLESFPCSRHQGYVMEGLELDSEMAAELFLKHDKENEEVFSTETKPDFVIIFNGNFGASIYDHQINSNEFPAIDENRNEMKPVKKELIKYFDSRHEESTLVNFFLYRDIIPIEITIDRDLNRNDIQQLFESIKTKIGAPRTYNRSTIEQEEIRRLKSEIVKIEENEKIEMERKKALMELEKKQQDIEKLTNQMLEEKRLEVIEMEKQSLPIHHYLMKYILPNITDGLVEMTRCKPKEPIQFLVQYLFSQNSDKILENHDLDEDVAKAFQNLLINDAKCV